MANLMCRKETRLGELYFRDESRYNLKRKDSKSFCYK